MATRTESLVGKLSIEDAEWRAGLAKASSQFKGFSSQISTGLGGAFKGGLAGVSSFVAGAGNMLRGLMSNIAGLAGALGIGGLLSAGGIVAGIKNITDMGGALKDTAARTGIAIDDLVILQEQFRQGGIEASSVTTYVKKLNEALLDSKKGDLFTALGLDPATLRKAGPVDTINAVIDAIRKVNNTALQQKALGQIFGSIQLMTLVDDPNSEKGARAMVGGLSGSMKKNAGAFDDISDLLFGGIPVKLQQIFAGFTEGLLPILSKVTEVFAAMDFTETGKLLGDQLLWAYNVFAGLWNNGSLWTFAGANLQKVLLDAAVFFSGVLSDAISWAFTTFVTSDAPVILSGLTDLIAGKIMEAFASLGDWINEKLGPLGPILEMAGQFAQSVNPANAIYKQLGGPKIPQSADEWAIAGMQSSQSGRNKLAGVGVNSGNMLADLLKDKRASIDAMIATSLQDLGPGYSTSPITKAGGLPALLPKTAEAAPKPLFPDAATKPASATQLDKLMAVLAKGVTVRAAEIVED